MKTFYANDPTRPVTQALFCPNVSLAYEDGLADLLDVVGYNYREQEILAAHAQEPTRKIIGTENSHDRNQWIAMRDHPEYSGQILWCGIDYLGESRTWPTIGSGSGLLNSVALPPGRAFERQSWWTTTPMVAMVRRMGAVRAAGAPPDPSVRFSEPLLADWTPKSLHPHVENVDVYTNAEEVEVFLNGKSVGTDKLHADASAISFKVLFEQGTLKAVARSHGRVVATEELKTAGKVPRIFLTADSPTSPLTPDWNDVRYVTATLVDDAGTRAPESTTLIHFATVGPASIVAVDSGDFTDHDPYQATQRKVYFGNAIAIVRAIGTSGWITVTAAANGIPSARVALTAAPIDKEDHNISMSELSARSF